MLPVERTILHEFLSYGILTAMFLDIPGLDVNRRDAEGRTLLLAAYSGFTHPDDLLNREKFGPKHAWKQMTISQGLISLGADIKATDNRGRNVTHYLTGILKNRELWTFEKSLAELCKMEPDLLTMADEDGGTSLQYAITWTLARDNGDLPNRLLSRGADPLVVDNQQNNLLHMLVQNLFWEETRTLFESLVSRGLDINGRNKMGDRPLFRFCDPLPTISKPDPWQVDFDIEQTIVIFLNRLGMEFFATDAEGRGALHLAAMWDVKRFKELMGMGLDVMLEDNSQQSPIDVAAACGNTAVLELLEKKDL